ncbi:MAG: iron hydrogenase small subunit [Evtepia gabavorous]
MFRRRRSAHPRRGGPRRPARAASVRPDQESPIRFSHENPTIQTLYRNTWAIPCRRPPITCSIQTSASGRCNPITANAAKELVPLPRLLFFTGRPPGTGGINAVPPRPAEP